jgi:transcription termination factor Rho
MNFQKFDLLFECEYLPTFKIEFSAAEFLIDKVRATKTNGDFFDSMKRG